MWRPYDNTAVYEVHILGLSVGAAMAVAEKIAESEESSGVRTVVWQLRVARRWRGREVIASYGSPPR